MNGNPYTSSFIGATGEYPIYEKIIETSNILEQHSSNYTSNTSNSLESRLSYTSNILEGHSSNFTNALRYDVNKWINDQTDVIIPGVSTTNTYVLNSNVGGYIKFWTKDSEKVYTRINQDGKLQIYHDYEIARPNLNTKWYQVEDILMDYLFNMVVVNAGAVATGVKFDIIDGKLATQEGQILTLYDAIILLNIEVTQHEELINVLYTELDFARYKYFNGLPDATTIANSIRQNIQTVSRTSSYIQNLFTSGVIIGAIGGAIGLIISNEKEASRIHQLYNYLNDPKSPARYLNDSDKNNIINEVNTSFVNNMFSYNSNISNLCILNGFINSNITSQQYIPALKIDYISASNLNASNLYTSNLYTSNLYTSNLYTSYISTSNLSTSNLTTSNLYTNNININSGNINGIDINTLKTSGNIIENGTSLSSKYLTSNHLYNMTPNYTAERQYPPKLYTTTQTEDTISLLSKLVYHQILYLDNQLISYGAGFYELYSSSTYNTSITSKDKLFNFNTSETTTSPRWAISQYSSGTGDYLSGNFIVSGYYGDWVIIKMPTQIMLTRYRIYQRSDYLTKAPALWKVYGSNDGITFTEITDASQTTRLTSYSSGYYEKTIASISPLYSYIGFVFSSLLSTSGQSDLSFSELQIFGKEVISNTITSQIYTTSNICKNLILYDTPQVCKHNAFYCQTTTPIFINGGNTQYYKYDIDMTNYTTTGYIQIGSGANDPYRIFRIRAFFGSCYFSKITNGLPDILHYEIYMSSKAAAGGSGTTAGINIFAIGYPNNSSLNVIPPNNLFIISNPSNNFNYITLVSTSQADVRCVIEDLLS